MTGKGRLAEMMEMGYKAKLIFNFKFNHGRSDGGNCLERKAAFIKSREKAETSMLIPQPTLLSTKVLDKSYPASLGNSIGLLRYFNPPIVLD